MDVNLNTLQENLALTVPTLTTLPKSGNISDLTLALKSNESRFNPDIIINLNELRFNSWLALEIPGMGSFNLTPWAKCQANSLLGFKWNKWLEHADMEEQAFLLNRRLQRSDQEVKLRTYGSTLAALVSKTFTPVNDSYVASILNDVLPPECPTQIINANMTDKTLSFTISITDKKIVGGRVGELIPGLYFQNSNVGYCSLKMYLMIKRLSCSNGQLMPVAQHMLLRRKHTKGIAEGLFDEIMTQCLNIHDRIDTGLNNIEDAQFVEVTEPEAEITNVLKQNGLPKKMVPMIMQAWNREPLYSKFGISQAINDNRMITENNLDPETAEVLQRVAGKYLLPN